MRTVIVGLGGQGRRRAAIAGVDLEATVDPVVPGANYRTIEEVPLGTFDAALVCTPDQIKLDTLTYLLSEGKHVLVEKPLVISDQNQFRLLNESAKENGIACYTAYNHRFEPHIVRLKELLEEGGLGHIYRAGFFYGNGAARDIKESPWRDRGLGVLSDLGSHLLDLSAFLFGQTSRGFKTWQASRFETRSFDHAIFGCDGSPALNMEVSFLCWRNTFAINVIGELGSAHINGLCKWGPSTLTVRKRVLPSGVPKEQVETIEVPDPTWELEYEHFKDLCETGTSDLERDRWISAVLDELSADVPSQVVR